MNFAEARKWVRTEYSIPAATLGHWKTFLEQTAPNVSQTFAGLACAKLAGSDGMTLHQFLPLRRLDLHCDRAGCTRELASTSQELGISSYRMGETQRYVWLTYTCSDCGKTAKTFAFVLEPPDIEGNPLC